MLVKVKMVRFYIFTELILVWRIFPSDFADRNFKAKCTFSFCLGTKKNVL